MVVSDPDPLLSNCQEVWQLGYSGPEGVHSVDPTGGSDPANAVDVHCVDSGWTTVLRRGGTISSESFINCVMWQG